MPKKKKDDPQLACLKEILTELRKLNHPPIKVAPEVPNNTRLETQAKEIQNLQAFKKYVHSRLDSMGVPEDPDPETTEVTGCRIGVRLQWVEDSWKPSAPEPVKEVHSEVFEEKELPENAEVGHGWKPLNRGDVLQEYDQCRPYKEGQDEDEDWGFVDESFHGVPLYNHLKDAPGDWEYRRREMMEPSISPDFGMIWVLFKNGRIMSTDGTCWGENSGDVSAWCHRFPGETKSPHELIGLRKGIYVDK